MRPIDTYFYDSPDKPLYHYTGIGTLVGLAEKENRAFWASHVGYMNDSKEMLHACEEVMKYVAMPSFIFGDKEHSEFLNAFRRWLDQESASPPNLFIFSLSEEQSLLSQWRSYTPHGKGISIGFSTGLVRTIAKENNSKLGKCVYTMPEQCNLIESLINELWILFNSAGTENESFVNCIHFFNTQRNNILQVLALIKHEAFAEEQEWRLISNEQIDLKDVFFRPADGAALLTPYIKLRLPSDNPLFDLIMLGPTPHGDLALNGLSMFLRNTGLSRYVAACEIPYREW